MSESWDYTPTKKLRFVRREIVHQVHEEFEDGAPRVYTARHERVLQQWWSNPWTALPGQPPLPTGEWRDVPEETELPSQSHSEKT